MILEHLNRSPDPTPRTEEYNLSAGVDTVYISKMLYVAIVEYEATANPILRRIIWVITDLTVKGLRQWNRDLANSLRIHNIIEDKLKQ
ncbi:hypothetical protein TNCV_4621111 [Trichonephila clavipes]|nr:hypothetical protein TNCV_4621111 [Trichonephila clavipes]